MAPGSWPMSDLTVLNYSSAKEDLVLGAFDESLLRGFADAVRSCRPGESVVSAVRALVFARFDHALASEDFGAVVATAELIEARPPSRPASEPMPLAGPRRSAPLSPRRSELRRPTWNRCSRCLHGTPGRHPGGPLRQREGYPGPHATVTRCRNRIEAHNGAST